MLKDHSEAFTIQLSTSTSFESLSSQSPTSSSSGSNSTTRLRPSRRIGSISAMKAYDSAGCLHLQSGDVETGSVSPTRSESEEKPKYTASTKTQRCARLNSRAVAATCSFLVFLVVIGSNSLPDGASGGSMRSSFRRGGSFPIGGATNVGYFFAEDAVKRPNKFAFAAITDLDQLSVVDRSNKKLQFKSFIAPGTLAYDASADKYKVDFLKTRKMTTNHNEAGRGGEFSELTVFDDRLLTFDDRTGDVFEILNSADGKTSHVVPRLILAEGDGNTDKGAKWEWATTRNNGRLLNMGSIGKEYTDKNGSIINTNNYWVAVYDRKTGKVSRSDWTRQYEFVRHALGADSPGYVVHEAVLWSDNLQKWVFAPRRISKKGSNDANDERRGSNKIVLVDDDFTEAKVLKVNMASKDGLRGFSSLAFVPGTDDEHALALRSVEEDCAGDDLSVCKQRSYLIAFNVLTGKVLMDEIKIKENMKFEGVEFVDIFSKPPTGSTAA